VPVSQRRTVRTKTSSVVVEYILEELFEGRIKSGDRLDLDGICEELDVSRLPVREAVVMLERDGVVSTKYHRGVYVEPFDAESILDDFEIMGFLSGLAVSRLADKQDVDTIAALESLVEQLRTSDPSDPQRTFELVGEIMALEHRAGGSRRLRAELRTYHGYLPHAFRYTTGRSFNKTVKAHQLVLQAVQAGDGQTAAEYRIEDFRDAGKRVVRELKRRGVIVGV
jgi:DNA-binding GntR family transcriptional regulator